MIERIRKASSPKVSAKALANIRIVVIASIAIYLLLVLLEISLMAKNLTYASRFTPPSTEKYILNKTYNLESQVLVIILLTINLFCVIGMAYATFNRGLKAFMISTVIALTQNVMIVIFCLYFLAGGSDYR